MKGHPPKYLNAIFYKEKKLKTKKITTYKDLWKKTPILIIQTSIN
jgi:hypothetical protein